MTNKKSSKPAADQQDEKGCLRINEDPTKTQREQLADIALSPIIGNTINALNLRARAGLTGQGADMGDLVEAMERVTTQVQSGDMQGMEAMLAAQAVTLDCIFSEMTRRAILNMGDYTATAEMYMRLALKAQTQSRATIQTISDVKHPRQATFVKQANIAHGPQQVNNNGETSRTEENENEQNKLLGVNDERQWLDTGTQSAASEKHPSMEAVGAVERPKVAAG